MIKVSELAGRQIINLADGRRLGPLKDLELDPATGRVRALVLKGGRPALRLIGLARDVRVPWERIRKIGVDAVLVEVEEGG
ncbi:MAG: YlmC/YmxH family sporulation protein [Firmicutes bacterium]|nr:YlmC/YmxH family sporulation protein [Bacillota bacterium]